MFGHAMHVELDGVGVTLRPPQKSEIAKFSELYSSMLVQRYTTASHAVTPEGEIEWWEKTSKDPGTFLWAIVPDGSNEPVGNTGLHGIHPLWGSCTSGIVIVDKNYWGKGIAYRCHLARTWYAVNTLNRTTIQSSVRTKNVASLKALLKVGYQVTGTLHRDVFREGKYIDTYVLSWVNPYRTDLLYPEGVPDDMKESLEKAKSALELANQAVSFI